MQILNIPVSKEISFKKTFQINIPSNLNDNNIKYLITSLKRFVLDYKKQIL